MKVTVTQQHINRGKRCILCECPLALALKDATGQYWAVHVNYIFNIQTGVSEWNLPPNVFKFIADFDRAQEVSPFEFELL